MRMVGVGEEAPPPPVKGARLGEVEREGVGEPRGVEGRMLAERGFAASLRRQLGGFVSH